MFGHEAAPAAGSLARACALRTRQPGAAVVAPLARRGLRVSDRRTMMSQPRRRGWAVDDLVVRDPEPGGASGAVSAPTGDRSAHPDRSDECPDCRSARDD